MVEKRKGKVNIARWFIQGVLALCLCMLLIVTTQGCSTPAGKAATYKAKKASPIHDTKVEKAKKKTKKATKKDKGLLKK